MNILLLGSSCQDIAHLAEDAYKDEITTIMTKCCFVSSSYGAVQSQNGNDKDRMVHVWHISTKGGPYRRAYSCRCDPGVAVSVFVAMYELREVCGRHLHSRSERLYVCR